MSKKQEPTAKIYKEKPKTKRELERRLRQAVNGDEKLFGRAFKQLARTALIANLCTHAIDEQERPIFAIKGGFAMELLMSTDARATQDLDVASRVAKEEVVEVLQNSLPFGWEGFSFEIDPSRIEDIENAPMAMRIYIKVKYLGTAYTTVQFEPAPAEGATGAEMVVSKNTFVNVEDDLGFSSIPGGMPMVTIGYLIAQKLHACTDHSKEKPNDRHRDLIDLVWLSQLIGEEDLPAIQKACEEIFVLRNAHDWPPMVQVLDDWPAGFLKEAKDVGFEPSDVHEAAKLVQALIHDISQSSTK